MGAEEGTTPILPDVLAPGLRVVFCGSAVGRAAAAAGAYYAGPGNRFWEILHRTGLTPRRLAPQEFRTVLDYGIGLTDVVKSVSGSDDCLRPAHFDADGLRRKIAWYVPRVLAFNGKRAAQAFCRRRFIDYGRQTDRVGPTVVFVLPSTSGAARRYWDEAYWRELADFVR